MKKSLMILCAAGALALAGCQKSGFVSAPSETIGFRTSLASSTRATATISSTLESFNAYAIKDDENSYFENVTFTKGADGTFTSATEYIWPEGNLDFFAYSPVEIESGQVEKTDYKTFTVKPSDDFEKQVDFIYANTNGKTKASNADGVSINFRHTESQIALKVKNSSASLKFEVAGWKVAYLSKSGKFTYADTDTDAANTQLAKTSWSGLGPAAVTNAYVQNLTSNKSVEAGAAEAVAIGESFILIPQEQTAASKYAAATTSSPANGSYIAVKLIIKNALDNDSVVYPDGADAAWAMWPVDFNWEPGKKYTYIVDLSGGGYSETNTDTDEELDEVLEGAVIKFVEVKVDEFVAQDENLPMSEAEEEPEEETTTGTAKATIGGSEVDVNWVQLWENGPKFAEYNVGVTDGKAESYGGCYTWGGTHVNGGDISWVDDHNTTNTGSENLLGDADTATKLWGSDWRMPTSTELQGLLDNCTFTWTENYNGTSVKGLLCTGKGAYASNSVFLPAAGYCGYGDVDDQGFGGSYWSSTPNGSDGACYLYFDSGTQDVYYFNRNYGFSVRAVLAE